MSLWKLCLSNTCTNSKRASALAEFLEDAGWLSNIVVSKQQYFASEKQHLMLPVSTVAELSAKDPDSL